MNIIQNTFIIINFDFFMFFSTKDPGPGISRAQSGGDYRAAVGESTDLGPGVASGNVTVQILRDNAPELDESFLVEITSAEALGLPSGSNNVPIREPKTVNVTIRANDQPYGLLGIYMKNTGGNGSNYAVVEPESGTTTVTFEVRRSQGTFLSFHKSVITKYFAICYFLK